jgi:hypothetical protein
MRECERPGRRRTGVAVGDLGGEVLPRRHFATKIAKK